MTVQQKTQLRVVSAAEPAGAPAQGLVELSRAVKGAAFYPLGHPYRVETLQRAFEVLRALLTKRELMLTVSRQGFQQDGEKVEGGGAMVQQLAHECFIRRIASLTLMQDLRLCDLELLVGLLNSDPQRAVLSGGVARELEALGSKTVWINEKDLDTIWEKRGDAAAGKGGQGDQEGGEDDGFQDLELGQAPGEGRNSIAELLHQMAQETGDRRYQELGRELLERLRSRPGQVPIVPVLAELLRQHRESGRNLPQREYALFILEHLADASAETLLDLLESRDYQDKEAIHRILAVLGAKGAYRIIQRICLSQGLYERKSLALALVNMGTASLPPLIAMLKDERWYVVRNMAAIIGELRAPEGVVPLKSPLYHEDVRVRKEAVRALMKIGGGPAEAALMPLLGETNEGVVRCAVAALGTMRSQQALPELLRLLEKRDLWLKGLTVKKEVLAALARLGDRRVTPVLIRMLGSRWPVFGRWLELRLAVAAALGILGDEAALGPLRLRAKGRGSLAEACREALDAIERVSGGSP